MNTTTIPRIVHAHLVSDTWALDSLRQIRDALQALDGLERLAVQLSEAIGGLSKAPTATALVRGNRRIDDGLDDFEDAAEWQSLGDTPIDVLAMSLPPISGGSDEADPSPQDWADYCSWREAIDLADREAWMNQVNEGVDDGGPLSESDIQIATGSF